MTNDTEAPYDEQLKLLFDYTKFHIGLYTGLVTLMLAVLAFGGDQIPTDLMWCARLAIALIAVAGMCGGIVVGNIPEHKNFHTFWNCTSLPLSSLPILSCVKCKAKYWATAEHVFFWIAILVVVVPVVLADSSTWEKPLASNPSRLHSCMEVVEKRR